MIQKVALVTGSNRGIGFATVEELLKKGYRVILTSRKEEDGLKAIDQLKEYGDLHFHLLDVANPDSVRQIVQYIKHEFGRLDILINNAAINYDTWQNAVNADLIEAEDTLNINLLGAWRMAQAVIPLMKNQEFGRIVNVSSGSGSLTRMGAGTPAYAMSKAAMNVLTIKLAADLQEFDILVNSVCPGWVKTDMGGAEATRSPKKGAETIVWAAELPQNGPNGKFFRDMEELGW